jgi:hypothetical protein
MQGKKIPYPPSETLGMPAFNGLIPDPKFHVRDAINLLKGKTVDITFPLIYAHHTVNPLYY